MIKADKLRAILESAGDDLRELASIAGGHPASFYRGANFDDADLRGQDLRGFSLDAATFERTRVDRNTKVDSQYREQAGLQRALLRLPAIAPLSVSLGESNITLKQPFGDQLGDIVEDAVFSHKLFTKQIQQPNFPWRISNHEEEINIKTIENEAISFNNLVEEAGKFILTEWAPSKGRRFGYTTALNAQVTLRVLSDLETMTGTMTSINVFATVLLIRHLSERDQS